MVSAECQRGRNKMAASRESAQGGMAEGWGAVFPWHLARIHQFSKMFCLARLLLSDPLSRDS